MPNPVNLYEIRLKTPTGFQKRTVEAETAAMAAEKMGDRGKILSIKEKKHGTQLFKKRTVTPEHRYLLFMRLSMMSARRVPLIQALGVLETSMPEPIKSLAKELKFYVSEGMDLVDAMRRDPKSFPKAVVTIIQVSRQDSLASGLREAAKFEEELSKTVKGKKGEIVKGFIMLYGAVALCLGAYFWIVPYMSSNSLLQQLGAQSMDVAAQIALWSGVIVALFSLMFSSILFLATIGRLIAPVQADELLLKVPFVRDIALAMDNYLVMKRMGLMLTAGAQQKQVLTEAIEDAKKGQLKRDLKEAYKIFESGEGKWPMAMTVFHPTDRAALMTSDTSEMMGQTMLDVAETGKIIYKKRLDQLGPIMFTAGAMAMVVAGFVLFYVTTIPILESTANVMKNF